MSIFNNVPNVNDWSIQIYATDLSMTSIKFAQNGVYSKFHLSRLPKLWIKKFFIYQNKKYIVNNQIKSACTFTPFNLISSKIPSMNFDVVLLRNVLYYFDKSLQTKVLRSIKKSINPDYFVFGLEESISLEGYKPISKDSCIYFNYSNSK
jgi:chemotaxis methyl-accepting protein methylase